MLRAIACMIRGIFRMPYVAMLIVLSEAMELGGDDRLTVYVNKTYSWYINGSGPGREKFFPQDYRGRKNAD